jgi:hypothetical protein
MTAGTRADFWLVLAPWHSLDGCSFVPLRQALAVPDQSQERLCRSTGNTWINSPGWKPHEGDFKHGLSNRQIQIIAIGGAIGTGLFMGPAHGCNSPCPALALFYLVCGFFAYLILRCAPRSYAAKTSRFPSGCLWPPFTSWLTLAFLAGVLVLMAFDFPDGTVTVCAIPVLAVILTVGWVLLRRRVPVMSSSLPSAHRVLTWIAATRIEWAPDGVASGPTPA